MLCAAMIALLLSIQTARAGDTRKAVKAQHGEIVVFRAVPTRPATRMQPPGTALLIDPRPNRQLNAVLGKGSELSDAEIAALSASPVQTTVRHIGNTLTQTLGTPSTGSSRQVSPNSAPPGEHPMGAIGQATRGLGSAMQQAMSAIPMPAPTSNR
jgi:hypothetical protein